GRGAAHAARAAGGARRHARGLAAGARGASEPSGDHRRRGRGVRHFVRQHRHCTCLLGSAGHALRRAPRRRVYVRHGDVRPAERLVDRTAGAQRRPARGDCIPLHERRHRGALLCARALRPAETCAAAAERPYGRVGARDRRGDLRFHAARLPMDRPRARLSSVANSIRLLTSFSGEENELGITTLATLLRLAKSTVHRLAATLTSAGFLEQNSETGKYRLGVALFELGALVRRRMDVANEARPKLRELLERTGETVQLGIVDHESVLYVYEMESRHA